MLFGFSFSKISMVEVNSSLEILENKIARLEAENRALKEKEFQLLSTLPEIVFMLDIYEKLVFLNNTCIDKFQLRDTDIDNGLYLKDILTPDSLIKIRKLYLKEGRREQLNAELTGISKNNSTFPFAVYFSRLENEGILYGFIGIGFDLTEREGILNKLKEADLAKMKFFSIIAHDLRNPFNSLVGFSSLLLTNFDKYTPEKIKEYLQYMSKSANQGYQLLENLLEWARANTGKIEINKEYFNLVNVINDAINLLVSNASKKNINIIFQSTPSLTIYADQNMIRTVIRNLLSNAIKFTHRNGWVSISVSQENEFALVEVKDNGIGIKHDDLKNLFSLSRETNSIGTERETGTGLGLNLCYEFMNLNNGKIEVTSELNEGSSFKISIPLKK